MSDAVTAAQQSLVPEASRPHRSSYPLIGITDRQTAMRHEHPENDNRRELGQVLRLILVEISMTMNAVRMLSQLRLTAVNGFILQKNNAMLKRALE